MNNGQTRSTKISQGTPRRTTRSLAKWAGPLRAMAAGANRPATKKNVPITKRAVGPTTTAMASSDLGWNVVSFTSSYGHPPIAE